MSLLLGSCTPLALSPKQDGGALYLAVVFVDVDPHNGFAEGWVGGGDDVVVDVLLVVHAVQTLHVHNSVGGDGVGPEPPMRLCLQVATGLARCW